MEYIAHRIHAVDELRKLPRKFGVELDLRGSIALRKLKEEIS